MLRGPRQLLVGASRRVGVLSTNVDKGWGQLVGAYSAARVARMAARRSSA